DTALATPAGTLAKFRRSLAQASGRTISESEFRELCTEALVWMIVHAINHPTETLEATFDRARILSGLANEVLAVVDPGFVASTSLPTPPADAAADPLLQYESHLAACDPSTRMRRGVFYTPRVIARHIVQRIDTTLRQRFELRDGLADTTTWHEMLERYPGLHLPPGTDADEPFVRILDPAAGTGIFLVEVIERIHSTMRKRWRNEGRGDKEMLAV
ncbi:MAG: hypothetical protein KDA71_25270, partial [Planctomycetales bacterium]|nr:hypothetical protein [Planctomycetales bacterium]